MNFQKLHSEANIPRSPLKEVQHNDYVIPQSCIKPYWVPTQRGRKKPIVGANLVYADNTEYCAAIVTTQGTFPIRSWRDIRALLQKGWRLLVVVQRTNQLSTLLKYFPPEALHYAYFSAEVDGPSTECTGEWIYLNKQHSDKWFLSDNLLEWHPCPCHHESCPHHGLVGGWIEVVNDAYGLITRKHLRSPERDLPSPKEIEDVFVNEERIAEENGISISRFTRTGSVAGQAFQLRYPQALVYPDQFGGDYDLWNEAMNIASEACSLGITRAAKIGIFPDAAVDDIFDAHMSCAAVCPVVTPTTCYPKVVEGGTLRDAEFISQIRSCAEVIAHGIRMPSGLTEPPQYTFDEGEHRGTIPTFLPVEDTVCKDNLLDLIDEGGNFINYRAIMLFPKPPFTLETLPTYRPYANWAHQVAEKSRYLKNAICKCWLGKVRSFYHKASVPLLPFDASEIKPDWRPTNYLSCETEYLDYEVEVPTVQNQILGASVLGRLERRMRKEIAARGRARDIGAIQDSVHSIGYKPEGKKVFGGYQTKNSVPKIAQLSDLHVCYEGDGRPTDWVRVLRESGPNQMRLEGNEFEYHVGLDAFGRGTIYDGHALLGTIHKGRTVLPLGSTRLLTAKVTVGDLCGGKVFTGQYAKTVGEVKLLLARQKEDDYDDD